MKAFVLSAMFLASCGSSVDKIADAIATSNATPTPAPGSSAPVATAQPTVKPPASRNYVDDFGKVSEGMTREEVITILGNYHTRDSKTFCDNGKCKEYEYLGWLYPNGKIGVTIEAGIATVIWAM